LRERLVNLGFDGSVIIELYRKDFETEVQLAESQRLLSAVFSTR
jgi:hypothetical protein